MADLRGVTNLVGPAGLAAVGTVERLSGVARFLPLEPGEREATYEGTTVVWWDGQRTELGPGGGVLLADRDGNTWEAAYEPGGESKGR